MKSERTHILKRGSKIVLKKRLFVSPINKEKKIFLKNLNVCNVLPVFYIKAKVYF